MYHSIGWYWRSFSSQFWISRQTQGCCNTGCRGFKTGIQNYKVFWLNINIPKGNCWILEIGVMGGAKLWLSNTIFYFKNHRNLSENKVIWKLLLSKNVKNKKCAPKFLCFFIKIYEFSYHLFSKMVSNTWQLATIPIIKIQRFSLCASIFSQKSL